MPYPVSFRLPPDVLAKLKTLEHLYPELTRNQIICGLLDSVLTELPFYMPKDKAEILDAISKDSLKAALFKNV